MSVLDLANVQIGQNVTASKNITLNTDADGNLIINQGVYPTLTPLLTTSKQGRRFKFHCPISLHHDEPHLARIALA